MDRARYSENLPNQTFGAETIIDAEAMSRTELDEPAMKPPKRAFAAADGGHFDGQIFPVTTPDGTRVAADEGIRRDTSLERLARLNPAFTDDGKVTAGNSPSPLE